MDFPDVYGWICSVLLTSEADETQVPFLQLCISSTNRKSLTLRVDRIYNGSMFFSLGRRFPSYDLPVLRLGSCTAEEEIAVEPMKFVIDPDIIESSNYKEVFNSAFLLLCSNISTKSPRFEFTEEALDRAAKQSTPPQLGVDVVECLMRSLGYKYTKWSTLNGDFMFHGPSTRSTYNLSVPGFSIISVYCPLLSMKHFKSGSYKLPQIRDERLQFALCYQQLESILQFRYAVNICQDWIELRIAIDNVRCDAVPLESDEAMHKQGAPNERHFPSRISLTIGPQQPSDVLFISLTRFSDNPCREITNATNIEAKFEPPISPGLKASDSVASTIKIDHWSFEQSSRGKDGTLEWTLYDTVNGKEVTSSKPPKSRVLDPKTWFKDGYSKAYRPFTKQGGVVFASDNYGQTLTWRLHKSIEGKALEWHVRGTIWLAYWPNTYNTYYCETRYHEYCQMVEITLFERS
eukprot:Gb_39272 [translate_table: standard]